MPDELSATEAAQRAELSKDHLMRLLRQGKITARQIPYPGGYYWMVDAASLDKYIHDWRKRKPGRKPAPADPDPEPGPSLLALGVSG